MLSTAIPVRLKLPTSPASSGLGGPPATRDTKRQSIRVIPPSLMTTRAAPPQQVESAWQSNYLMHRCETGPAASVLDQLRYAHFGFVTWYLTYNTVTMRCCAKRSNEDHTA